MTWYNSCDIATVTVYAKNTHLMKITFFLSQSYATLMRKKIFWYKYSCCVCKCVIDYPRRIIYTWKLQQTLDTVL